MLGAFYFKGPMLTPPRPVVHRPWTDSHETLRSETEVKKLTVHQFKVNSKYPESFMGIGPRVKEELTSESDGRTLKVKHILFLKKKFLGIFMGPINYIS